jgi:glycerol-3-phosphate acyltransferase PlsX
LAAAAELDPENTGGAMLLGVDGVCVISHGSSSAVAVANAIHIAYDLARAGLSGRLAASISAED